VVAVVFLVQRALAVQAVVRLVLALLQTFPIRHPLILAAAAVAVDLLLLVTLRMVAPVVQES